MLAHDKESGLGSPTYVIENIQESEKKMNQEMLKSDWKQ